MDDRWSLWPIKNDELEQVPRSIGSQYEISDRLTSNLLDHQRVLDAVLDVLVIEAVSTARRQDLHGKNRTTKPPTRNQSC
ncbi:MAG: hypothetical protein LC808_20110, partial [Actinobacteria bacterium]|nr:hypothetical protein [Actinomycetota bacterium]